MPHASGYIVWLLHHTWCKLGNFFHVNLIPCWIKEALADGAASESSLVVSSCIIFTYLVLVDLCFLFSHQMTMCFLHVVNYDSFLQLDNISFLWTCVWVLLQKQMCILYVSLKIIFCHPYCNFALGRCLGILPCINALFSPGCCKYCYSGRKGISEPCC